MFVKRNSDNDSKIKELLYKINNGIMPIEKAAEIAGIPVEEMKKRAGFIEEKDDYEK